MVLDTVALISDSGTTIPIMDMVLETLIMAMGIQTMVTDMDTTILIMDILTMAQVTLVIIPIIILTIQAEEVLHLIQTP
jgi:hypothetical protein